MQCGTCDLTTKAEGCADAMRMDEFIARLADDVYQFVHMTEAEKKNAELVDAQLKEIEIRVGFLVMNAGFQQMSPAAFAHHQYNVANAIMRRLGKDARTKLKVLVTENLTDFFNKCMRRPWAAAKVRATVDEIVHDLFRDDVGTQMEVRDDPDLHLCPVVKHRRGLGNPPGGASTVERGAAADDVDG